MATAGSADSSGPPRVRVDGAAQAQLWARHMQRLAEGARRLQLTLPDAAQLLAEAQAASTGLARAAVRLTVTRGVGERGYAPPRGAASTCIVMAAAAPAAPANWYARGVRLRRCELTLASQPRLAGIKHLNRLEQVLARAEWQDDSYAEGLLCDHAGHVIGATAANLFALIGDELVTPALDDCGIAGVTRAEVLARHAASVRRLSWEELMRAGEIFLTSSLRGILPVRSVGVQEFSIGALTRGLQRQWRDLGLMEMHDG